LASASSTASDSCGSSSAQTLTTSRGCEVGDLRDRGDDVVQLRAEALELVVPQLEPREMRDMKQLFACELGHLAQS
jgi:hypothetical protein